MSRLRIPTGRRTYHHGDLRAALLAQVGGLVREEGVAEVSLREVARRARVSHGAPAHHFKNKAGLLTAFAAEGYDRLADLIEQALTWSKAVTPPDRVELMGRAYIRFAVDNPEHFIVMYPGEGLNRADPEYIRASDRVFTALIEAIGEGARQGYLTANAGVAAAGAWSIAHGFSSLWLSRRLQERTGVSDIEPMASLVCRAFVDGVMRRVPEERPQVGAGVAGGAEIEGGRRDEAETSPRRKKPRA